MLQLRLDSSLTMPLLQVMNMIFLYYDNPLMLREQLKCWNTYLDYFENPPLIFLIDDGSPKTSAVDIVRKCGCKIPVQVFRVKENIPWNFSGARNLGCHHATDWIYVSDIDTLLPADAAQRFFLGRPLDPFSFYLPKRIYLPDFQEASEAIVNLLFHKDRYLAIGGYDEDYAGFYGREETDFFNRLKKVATKVYRDDVVIQVVTSPLIVDARTRGMIRDKTRNGKLYAEKKAAGFIKPCNPLRFSWERVL
jgi:hypothetical protein